MEPAAMPAVARRRLTTLDKLKVVAQQARCPLCNEKLGELDGLEFDHSVAVGLGGADDLANIVAVHKSPCHRTKTSGRRGEKRVTSAGSDIHAIAKTKRLGREEEEFRARLLRKQAGEKPERHGFRWPRGRMRRAKP